MYNSESSPVLTNVLMSGNQADRGGGMYNTFSGYPTLFNVTVSGNRALLPDQDSGGGILNDNDGALKLVNGVVWGNLWLDSPSQIANMYGGSAVVGTSIVQGGYTGTGNFDADPLFVAPISATLAPTTSGNHRLRYGSPAINVGTALSFATNVDLAGLPRVAAGTVDRGAYEAQIFAVVTLDGNGLGSVTSNPSGLACPAGLCAQDYVSGTVVTLTAAANPASAFTGWSGAVVTTANSAALPMTTTRSVIATFITHKTYLPLVLRQ